MEFIKMRLTVGYKVLCFTLLVIFELRAQSSESLALPDDYGSRYGSPTLEISSSVFDLNKKWMAPAGRKGISEMGAWITPNASGFTLLASILFGLNSRALDANYEKSLKTLIELSNETLPNNAGHLFAFSYFYNDLGTPDVNSVRFIAMGPGKTPDESLASGPISQISEGYSVTAVFPKKSLHFVWIFKSTKGSLQITTIKEPFIDVLRTRAMKIKSGQLEKPVLLPNYRDENVMGFERAQSWINQTKLFETRLSEVKRLNEVNRLNELLSKNEKDFKDLFTKYQQNLSESNKVAVIIRFLDVCESITSAFNDQANLQKESKTIYDFERSNLANEMKELNDRISILGNQMHDAVDRLKSIFQNSNIPLPPPQPIRKD